MSQSSPYFTEEHELFRQSVRGFIKNEVEPHVNQWEEGQRIPRSFWLRMGELGFLGINHDEAYGGTNNDFFYSVVLLEELGRTNVAGICAAHGVHQYMSTAHLMKVGTPELKAKYLPGAIDGTKIGSLAISEPGAGSDVANIRTTAVRDGDYYVIHGQKTFITNGVYGDYATVAVKTDPSAGIGGISLIMVDQGLPGFTTRKLKKIGWHSSDTGELFFDHVRVPVSNLVGEEGRGFYYIMDSFQLERLVTGIGSVGGCDAGIELTLRYINEREAFGRPIKKFQAIRHRLVDLISEIEAVRHLTYHASWLYNKGIFAVKECSMVKLMATEIAKKASDVCLQCFGGYGYIEEFPIARMYRDARVGTIVGGTSEIMKEILSKLIIDETIYQSAYEETEPNKTNSVNLADTNNQKTSMETAPQTTREIIESLPGRFRPEKAEGVNTVFHFDISGDRGGKWTITIQDGQCAVAEGHVGEANCLLTTNDQTYEDTELGRSNPQMAVMMGKIRISNLGEMMKFITFFKRLF